MAKVTVRFQFYFPYVLPRTDDWDGQGVAFEGPDITATVRPRRTDEELFPNDLDRTLSSMTVTLARESLPQSTATTAVRGNCHDRVEVLVERELPSLDDARQADVQEQIELKAIQAVNLFLDHARVVARSPFVLGIQRHFRLQDQRYYVLTPRTVAWFDGESGNRLPVYNGGINGQVASGAAPSPERGVATMEAIRASLGKAALPELAESLLLDAEFALVTLRIREALFALGTASEVASEQYIERKRATESQPVRDALRQRASSFAARRYDLVPRIIDGRSLAQDAPDTFVDLERAYRARNTVAHEGRAFYEEDGQAVEVSSEIAMRFLMAARQAVAWIASL
jgi:hypothetical protein